MQRNRKSNRRFRLPSYAVVTVWLWWFSKGNC